jgi:flavin-dependent dehydrogenase
LGEPKVVIVGGGPAGAAVGSTLARLGIKAIVLEARPGPERKVGECLPPNAGRILEKLGLRDDLQRDGHLPSYGNRSVWGASIPVERDFIFGTEGHGWHLDRLKFEESLAHMARESGVDWRYGHRLVTCSRQNGRWNLEVQSPSEKDTLEADFLVDATGRPARIARQFGAKQIRYDKLIGISCLFKSSDRLGIKDSHTLVEAVMDGWWYSARLPDNKMIVVYLGDSDLADHGARETGRFITLLERTEHTQRRVREGDYVPADKPFIQPANSSRLDRITGESWLAVGDAAAAFDPLSSYGISSALGGGFYAAQAIADSLAGHPNALPSYQKLIDDAYSNYLSMHYDYYSLEQRWPDELFWRRRQQRRDGDIAVQNSEG